MLWRTPSSSLSARYPGEFPSRVTVRLKGGRSYNHEVTSDVNAIGRVRLRRRTKTGRTSSGGDESRFPCRSFRIPFTRLAQAGLAPAISGDWIILPRRVQAATFRQ
jgi:hypothetical protein